MWMLAVLLAMVGGLPPLDFLLPANEASGLVASRRYAGVYYWLRDGGGSTPATPRAALWAMRLSATGVPQAVRGHDLFPFYRTPGVSNMDWEALTIDGDGSIWIGAIGANNCVNQQRLYRFAEPDPSLDSALELEAEYTIRFPDNPRAGCTTYNSEAMFWLDGHLYLVAKTHGSPVYRVDLPPAMAGEARLVRLGELGHGVDNISVAGLSDDRSRLVVADHKNIWVYASSDPQLCGDAYVVDVISRPHRWQTNFAPNGAAVEGGTFVRDSYAVAFVSEDRRVYYATPKDYVGPEYRESAHRAPVIVDRTCEDGEVSV